MKSRIAGIALALAAAAAGVLVTATPSQAHRQCFTTSSTTINNGRSSSTYCEGVVSCDWVVTKYHYVRAHPWTSRKKIVDAREYRCW
jgi:hypothetical protein